VHYIAECISVRLIKLDNWRHCPHEIFIINGIKYSNRAVNLKNHVHWHPYNCMLLYIGYTTMETTCKKVTIIGGGNWGSAVSKIVGDNVQKKSDLFQDKVNMWVYEEIIDGMKLTDIINTQHKNDKYLPGIKLPKNVTAIPDLVGATKDSDILVFVLPFPFVMEICKQLKGHIKPEAFAVSLVKGVISSSEGLHLVSQIIHKTLDIDVSVLMGANLADEVAREEFGETTIGARNQENGQYLYELFNNPHFQVTVVSDCVGVEIFGALKNIVAIGAGICDGMEFSLNTKAAVIRIGMMEMLKFAQMFYKGVEISTLFESCGVADLVVTCFGSKHRKVAEAMARSGKSVFVLIVELLNGETIDGPECSKEVNIFLKEKKMEKEFPLFTAVYQICYEGLPPSQLLKDL